MCSALHCCFVDMLGVKNMNRGTGRRYKFHTTRRFRGEGADKRDMPKLLT